MKKTKICMGLALLAMLGGISACGSKTNPLHKAYEEVITEFPLASSCFELSEDGSFVSVDTNPSDIDDYFVTDSFDAVETFNEKLGFPGYVWEDMLHTSSADGKQTESCGQIEVTWKYHPDRGLEATYKLLLS